MNASEQSPWSNAGPAPPTAEAKVTSGDKLLSTGQAYIFPDRSGGWFMPTHEGDLKIPREGASLTMWGTDDAIPIVHVMRRAADGKPLYRFTLALSGSVDTGSGKLE